jgi:hypothetical protein
MAEVAKVDPESQQTKVEDNSPDGTTRTSKKRSRNRKRKANAGPVPSTPTPGTPIPGTPAPAYATPKNSKKLRVETDEELKTQPKPKPESNGDGDSYGVAWDEDEDDIIEGGWDPTETMDWARGVMSSTIMNALDAEPSVELAIRVAQDKIHDQALGVEPEHTHEALSHLTLVMKQFKNSLESCSQLTRLQNIIAKS